jgi:hypothetical protein
MVVDYMLQKPLLPSSTKIYFYFMSKLSRYTLSTDRAVFMLYFAQGSALVTEEKFHEAVRYDNLTAFYHDFSKGLKPKAIKFSTGKLSVDNITKGFVAAEGAPPIKIEPIGLGKPLTIQIRNIYTGKYPTGIFGSKKGLLVTSAIKSITSFDAKPLAMNFLLNKISSQTHINRPPASRQGTPFIFYSPALLEKSLTLDLSIVFDNFPEEAFEQVGKLFTEAAGIPIFLSYSVYLIAAGLITKLAGEAGESIFDSKPAFTSCDGLDIYWPGCPPTPPGFMLITGTDIDRIDPDFRSKYRITDACEVVDDANNKYTGDIPFVVISLDGTPQDELTSFAPTAASAALLSRFYGIKDGQAHPIDSLLEAVKVCNDFHFRQQIDCIDAQTAKLQDNDPKKADLKEKRAALADNILNDLFKPK